MITRSLGSVVWLTAVWVALWEDLSAGTVVAGATVALLVVWITRPTARSTVRLRLDAFGAARFLAYFSRQLVHASLIVAVETVTPKNRVREGIVAVPLAREDDVVTTVVANAVSLTPGTLTIEARRDPTILYVHVLHLRDVEDVRRDVRRLERLVHRALRAPRRSQAPDPGVRT
jgi:multicomponent Na+:H+ antiporter subunit E